MNHLESGRVRMIRKRNLDIVGIRKVVVGGQAGELKRIHELGNSKPLVS